MRTEARNVSLVEPVFSQSTNSVAEMSWLPTRLGRQPLVRYILFFCIAIVGLFVDLASKYYVFQMVGPENSKPVWKGSLLGIAIQFDLATTFNKGALWGIGQGKTWIFASLSIAAICVICYFLWTRHAVSSWWLTISSSFVLAGTLGNLYDRLGLHGWRSVGGGPVYAVRDFLDFIFADGGFHWATFNVADILLVTGAIMLIIHSTFWSEEKAISSSSESAA